MSIYNKLGESIDNFYFANDLADVQWQHANKKFIYLFNTMIYAVLRNIIQGLLGNLRNNIMHTGLHI